MNNLKGKIDFGEDSFVSISRREQKIIKRMLRRLPERRIPLPCLLKMARKLVSECTDGEYPKSGSSPHNIEDITSFLNIY